MDTLALSQKIKTLDAKALKELLSEVKLYQDLSKKLGKRGEELFARKHSGEKLLVVEYFSAVGEDLAWEQAQNVYKKAFDLNIEKDSVKFLIDDSLKGGIKVYLEDSMVDLSFSKIEKTIKN